MFAQQDLLRCVELASHNLAAFIYYLKFTGVFSRYPVPKWLLFLNKCGE